MEKAKKYYTDLLGDMGRKVPAGIWAALPFTWLKT